MTNNSTFISVVSPVYLAEGIVQELVARLVTELEKITTNYEVILVNDGSPDNSWNEIVVECDKNPSIKAINLSRNFGQHYAIAAGLDYAKGEWVVVMDCDLQDRPEDISKLYAKAIEGYDIVMGQRIIRQDKLFKKLTAKLFYKIFNYLTEIKQDYSVANFGIYSCNAITAVKEIRETGGSFSLMIRWVGFKKYFLSIQHDSRKIGKSSYSWSKLIRLSVDIILSYSDRPLRFFLKIGMVISLFSFLFSAYYLTKYLSGEIALPGYTSIILSIWLLGGIILMSIGITGLYLIKVYENVKNRPRYFISKKINT